MLKQPPDSDIEISDAISPVKTKRILDTGCWMLDTGCWILDAGCCSKILSSAEQPVTQNLQSEI